MPKGSKVDRWQDTVGQAREALDNLSAAIKELVEIRRECSDSFDAMSEGLQGTERGQQFEAIANVSVDGLEKLVADIGAFVDDAESAV